ncbi:recombination regulator RecX [Evansella tamaricis]|uniref:Regulatory protein RecX n=1 Tax=Evansella tamaricis TaxID=2069301 RepID=A0ABS6JB61_9BACI|nr:recombination regulator RecX [Evansella tamaricis]MBU9710748.1 recombination regulator RecX [Evansella tamaricis]
MPITISKITIAKKNKGRFHIYVDRGDGNGDEYAFTVSEDIFIKRHLSKGKTLTEEEMNRIREEDVLDKAFQRTLHFISYRMRSEKEVLTYLHEQDIQKEEASQLLERLKDLNLLDDQAFAEAFVRTKKNTQKKGPLLIQQELYEKGITEKGIEKAMKEYPEEEVLENAMKTALKKQSSYQKEGQRKRQQKLMQFLIQRGFPSETARQVVESCDEQVPSDAEWEGLVKQGEKAEKKYSKYEAWEREQRIKQYLYQRGFSLDLIDEWLRNREVEN